MTLTLSHEPLAYRDLPFSTQWVFRFPNGYGASVVQGQYTYGGPSGLFELAVVRYNSEGVYAFDLTYDTPVTDDVIGWLGEGDLDAVLDQIKALPNPARVQA